MSVDAANAARAGQISALLALPIPRQVPRELRRAAAGQSAAASQMFFGAVFFVVGAIFAYVFTPWNYYRDLQLAANDTATARGRVLSAARSNLSLNKVRVYSYDFEFTPPAGSSIRGTCFTTGQSWRAGNIVQVRYRPEEPGVCCIAGARSSASTPGMGFVWLFPSVGAALMAWSIVARRRAVNLLERGYLAEALVTGVEETQVRVNNRYVYKILLQRSDTPDGGTFMIRRYQPEVVAFARARMEGQQPVFVLYDPANPKRAILPETL